MNKYLESKTLYYKLKGGKGNKSILRIGLFNPSTIALLTYFIDHPDIMVINDTSGKIIDINKGPIDHIKNIGICESNDRTIFSDPQYYYTNISDDIKLNIYQKYYHDSDYSSHFATLVGIIGYSYNELYMLIKPLTDPDSHMMSLILLFQDEFVINTLEFLKSCIPMFLKTLYIIKKDYNESYNESSLSGDYNIKIDKGVITEYKFIPTTYNSPHVEKIIYYIQNILNNIYGKTNTIYDYVEDLSIDSDIRSIISDILNYKDIKIEGIDNVHKPPGELLTDLGCGRCSFINYDETKTYVSNNPDGMLDIISYVLFAPADNHLTPFIQRLFESSNEFNDQIAKNIIEELTIYGNKYVRGVLNLGIHTDDIYNSNGYAWVIRLYYDDSLLQENNKILYEPILKWLNGKKNFQLIKFDFKDQQIEDKHNKLFGALIRIFPLFDSNVRTVAFRDIDSKPLIKDIKLLEDFRKSDKIIHVYDLYDTKTHPEWITCPMNILKNKYNFKFDGKYKFPLGLTAINNVGKNKFTNKNSQDIFDIINKEEKFIKKFNEIKYLDKRENDRKLVGFEYAKDINNIIKNNYISQHIPIASCLHDIHMDSIHYQYSLWNFGTDESLFNLIIYAQVDISDKTVYATKLYDIRKKIKQDKSYILSINKQVISIPEEEYEKFAYLTDNTKLISYIEPLISDDPSNPYKLFSKEIMPD
jgi:hypothetical protein